VPIFHNDVVEAGVRFTDVDILAIDDYPIKAYDRDWRGGVNPFANIDTFEQGHEAHGVKCPLFVAETQGGWYDLWGGKGYDYIRSFLAPDSLDITMKSCLAQGASILNLFMACGGTSFGYISSPDVYTSYDMAAPVSEGCSFSARGRAAKAFSDPDGSISVDDRNIFCKARKSVSGKRFVFLRNLTGKDREARIKPGGSTVSIPPSSMTVLMLDEKGGIQDERRPYLEAGERRLPSFELPRLERFSFAMISPQIDPDFDDSDWIDVPAANRLDMDALGLHFGFAWYRAELEKMVSSITIDARHCFAAYLNGHLLAARDNHGNRLAAGSDFAETVEIVPLQEHWRTGRNVLVILVESLGHNKGFLEDLHNPRGLVRVETQEGAIKRWKVRGGLVPGERGMTPRVDFDSLELDTEDVTLPHQWPLEQNGVGLYQTRFQLDLQKPDQPAIGFRVKSAPEKANIYLNGHLTGRYWESVGPQKLFYLPTAWLNQKGENHLAIAVWRWEDPSGLGEVNLEPYP
jgi:hypothetical protein